MCICFLKLFFMFIYTFKTSRNIFNNCMRFNQKVITNNKDNCKVTAIDLLCIVLDLFSKILYLQSNAFINLLNSICTSLFATVY